jgi:hypothetical protein
VVLQGLSSKPLPVDFSTELSKPISNPECVACSLLPLCCIDQLSLARISNFDLLASYSWIKNTSPDGTAKTIGKPTIVVPGWPPEWIDPKLPVTVRRDRRSDRRQQVRFPKSPILPIIASVKRCRPNFNFGDVDVVTRAGCLQSILRSLDSMGVPDGKWYEHKDLVFRIDLQLVGKKTVYLQRWQKMPRYPGWEGFGKTFLMACIKPLEGFHDHQRIITYVCFSRVCSQRSLMLGCRILMV